MRPSVFTPQYSTTHGPVTGDWDGDGTTNVGVLREVAGTPTFLLDTNGGGGAELTVVLEGASGGTPISGDWTGTGGADRVGLRTLGSTPNNLRYTGRERDPDSGLYYYRARYYDPDIGRFLSQDPLGFEAGPNFYAYVGNNPINANDPAGLDTVEAGGTAKLLGTGLSAGLLFTFPGVTDDRVDAGLFVSVAPGGLGAKVIGQFDPESPFAQSSGFHISKATVDVGFSTFPRVGNVSLQAKASAGIPLPVPPGGIGVSASKAISATTQVDPNEGLLFDGGGVSFGPQFGASLGVEAQFSLTARDVFDFVSGLFGSNELPAANAIAQYPSQPGAAGFVNRAYEKR